MNEEQPTVVVKSKNRLDARRFVKKERPKTNRRWGLSTHTFTTIGLACAQAVAIRGAPHVARRHAAVPRALQLRVALNDWDRNDVHERVRA